MANRKRKIVVVAHDVRSAHNVGSLLRTADGLGVEEVIFSGYTPYPQSNNDGRLPHIAKRVNAQIHKTALGAEDNVKWQKTDKLAVLLSKYENRGYEVAALEQTKRAMNLDKFRPPPKIVLVVGNEVNGLEPVLTNRVAIHLQIPMRGKKESFNVSVAAAIAIYYLLYI